MLSPWPTVKFLAPWPLEYVMMRSGPKPSFLAGAIHASTLSASVFLHAS
jgi:hypothetical protein